MNQTSIRKFTVTAIAAALMIGGTVAVAAQGQGPRGGGSGGGNNGGGDRPAQVDAPQGDRPEPGDAPEGAPAERPEPGDAPQGTPGERPGPNAETDAAAAAGAVNDLLRNLNPDGEEGERLNRESFENILSELRDEGIDVSSLNELDEDQLEALEQLIAGAQNTPNEDTDAAAAARAVSNMLREINSEGEDGERLDEETLELILQELRDEGFDVSGLNDLDGGMLMEVESILLVAMYNAQLEEGDTQAYFCLFEEGGIGCYDEFGELIEDEENNLADF